MKSLLPLTCIAFVLGLAGCATSTVAPGSGHLTFDVHPCAGDIHIALSSVQWTSSSGQHVDADAFDGIPEVLYAAGGEVRPLGSFEPGCSGALRLHEPPPARTGRIDVVVRARLKDGTVAVGTTPIDLGDY